MRIEAFLGGWGLSLVAGVDACKGGWVAVLRDGNQPLRVATYTTLRDLLDDNRNLQVAAVDIPIGLLRNRHRLADSAARHFIGVRGSSVFTTPPREAIEASSYQQANEISKRLTGSGLSKQSYALRQRILEVDQLDDPRIFEFHPEVTFAALNKGPLIWSKKSWNGLMTRLNLLSVVGLQPPNIVPPTGLGSSNLAGKVASDDLVDAAAGVWAAQRLASGAAQSLPVSPETDDRGNETAIWY